MKAAEKAFKEIEDAEFSWNRGPSHSDPSDIGVERDPRLIQDRLSLLGFISSRNQDPAALRAAVRSLQREAGIKVDGWVGPETWRWIQAALAFEDDEYLSQKSALPERHSLFNRAIRGRLAVLGINTVNDAATSPDSLPQDGLSQLSDILRRIDGRLTFDESNPSEFGGLVLDHSRLMSLLSRPSVAPTQAALKGTERAFFLKIAGNVAKIELWLQGYSVKLDGKSAVRKPANWSRLSRTAKRNHMEKSESLFAALEHFLHNYKKVTPSERRSIRIAGALAFRRDCSLFFRLFGELNQDEQPARADQEHSVIDALSRAEEENPEMLREMWKKSLRSKGSRLFDGIKRAASWLKKAAGFLLDFLKRSKWFFKNLLRMAISSAHEYLHGVRLAVSKLPKAITWFCSRRITIEGVPNATIVKQGGFDLSVVHTGNIRSALTVAREYRKGVLDMLFGLRFIGLISTGLKTYSQVQIGNFYALTRTLIRHVSSIRQFRRWYQFEMERADRI